MAPPDVRALALALPIADRVALARDLLRSVDDEGPGDETVEATAWEAEIARRARAVIDGTATLVAWDDVNAQITADLAVIRGAQTRR